MKSGRHPHKRLTAAYVRSCEAGRHGDGNGLYLVVDPSGARRWVVRVVVQGKRRDIGLGSTSILSLSEAREQATELRKIARGGGDPVSQRNHRKLIPTFEKAARLVHSQQSSTWQNAKHSAQWITTLEKYVFPEIGHLAVDQIGSSEVYRVLAPIWQSKQETASRVKQRIGVVLDWAKVSGFRSGENPILGIDKGLPKRSRRVKHFTALPYADVPIFIRDLRKADASISIKLAFEFLILTASRTGETLGATWSEFDGDTWVIPSERMKAKQAHRVPLSPRCLEILKLTQTFSTGQYVFPGRTEGKALSNMVFLETLKRMGISATTHGFRSSFKDWATECTSFPLEVSEAALAHTIKDKTEAAYRRGDLLEKRRSLMLDWEKYVLSAISLPS